MLTAGLVVALVLAVAIVTIVTVLPPADPPATSRPTASPAIPQGSAESGVLTAVATISGLDAVYVSEVVVWATGGPSRLRLVVREHPELLGDAAKARAQVEGLSVRVDHIVVPATAVSGFANAWDVDRPTSIPPQRMELTYRLRGAVVRSAPSLQDRAVAVLSPLAAMLAPGDSTLTVRGVGVSGVGVRNLYCPGLPFDQLLCGRHSDGTWTARLPGAASSPVLVQLDLPSGG